MKLHVLNETHDAVAVSDPLEWALWFCNDGANARVAFTKLPHLEVSTVFIGCGHVLFETAVFWKVGGTDHVDVVARYRTWDEAEAGHARWVERLTLHPPSDDQWGAGAKPSA
jgi:hypothetical protein